MKYSGFLSLLILLPGTSISNADPACLPTHQPDIGAAFSGNYKSTRFPQTYEGLIQGSDIEIYECGYFMLSRPLQRHTFLEQGMRIFSERQI
jgi:hypothetical protein